MDNKILKLSYWVARFLQVAYAVMILFSLYFLMMVFLDLPRPASMKLTSWLSLDLTGSEALPQGQFNILVFFLKIIAKNILLILALESLIKCFGSIKTYRAFQETNTYQFKRIGKLLVYCFIIVSLDLSYEEENFRIGFSPELTYLLLGLLSLVIAEVFKEGNRLREENELTI
ncbi:DUF2975 domain-containing protein [Gramella sp. BOM4]|nr:DUF2975 domain-containing protein [Christiangramia bathymodioli]